MEGIQLTLERMEQKIDAQAGEIKGLHKLLTEKNDIIDKLETELGDVKTKLAEVEARAVWQEQRNRNMCVKVNGVQIDKEL